MKKYTLNLTNYCPNNGVHFSNALIVSQLEGKYAITLY